MLLPGDWVEILSASQIVATLDADQSVDGLPFMPEMLPHAGRRLRVIQRAERTCTYDLRETSLRRLEEAVVLDGLRCDGSAHGGCEMGCRLIWKERWLRKVEPPASPTATSATSLASESMALRATTPDGGRYMCQATELPRATAPGDPLWSPGQYVRFVRVRTFTPIEVIVMFATPPLRRLRRSVRGMLRRDGGPMVVDDAPLGLQAGEWVQVKSRDEIMSTLDERRMHKGLSFGGEMYGQCGKTLRVQRRVERIMAEGTGKIRTVRDTVLLDGSACDRYLGCARAMPFLWREAWLRRVPTPAADASAGGDARSG